MEEEEGLQKSSDSNYTSWPYIAVTLDSSLLLVKNGPKLASRVELCIKKLNLGDCFLGNCFSWNCFFLEGSSRKTRVFK